jgi:hypothetical protein
VPQLLLSRAEAARALGVSLRLLDTLQIPSILIGRRRLYAPDRLREWIAAQSGPAT